MFIESATRMNGVAEYYFSTKLTQIQQLNKSGFDIINLGIGSPDLPPHPDVIDALTSSALEKGSHGYQSYKGIDALREAIANYYNRTYGVTFSAAKNILPMLGSKEAISHICQTFVNPGDVVLVPNPGYPTYEAAAKMAGGTVHCYDLLATNDYQIDLAKLACVDLDKVKLVWINYPHMPTGARANKMILNGLVNLARKHKFLIVNDNPYSRILCDKPFSVFQLGPVDDVVIELNSLSKSHNMAGWRMGWMIGNENYVQMVLKCKSNMDSGMFLPIQKAAVKALSLSDEWFYELNKAYAIRRAKVFEMFALLNCSFDTNQVGMFVWAKLPKKTDNATNLRKETEHFVEKLMMEAEVFITPGFIFGSGGDGYIRASLCSNVSVLDESIKRIGRLLEKKQEKEMVCV